MSTSCRFVLSLLAALLASACSSDSGANKPEYKKNPDPKQRREISVVLDNAPGAFAVVDATMQFDIINMDCLPPAEPSSGVQTTPTSTFLPIVLIKASDGSYKGEVALDGLLDGDYFGQGVCKFKPVVATTIFKATGADGETRFIASLSAEEIRESKSKKIYYWRGGYPKEAKLPNYPDYGYGDPMEFKEGLRDDLFSIRMAPEVAPP
ncbi:MAG TPA: hypothetical protein VJM34_11900 [Novosphingobium sp.]|uniref:hypothetical protein n=1 Tax=Lysobacter TaxID=68 RepID=UPI00126A10C1|nr:MULTISPECIES: hypothetical protein [Lysobacter]HKX79212.1 hypothetical protein [Novosphingobium sp.]